VGKGPGTSLVPAEHTGFPWEGVYSRSVYAGRQGRFIDRHSRSRWTSLRHSIKRRYQCAGVRQGRPDCCFNRACAEPRRFRFGSGWEVLLERTSKILDPCATSKQLGKHRRGSHAAHSPTAASTGGCTPRFEPASRLRTRRSLIANPGASNTRRSAPCDPWEQRVNAAEEHRLYARDSSLDSCNLVIDSACLRAFRNGHQTDRLYSARSELVAGGRLMLKDQVFAVVGAAGLEPATSCV
jgi:hypothetical protein